MSRKGKKPKFNVGEKVYIVEDIDSLKAALEFHSALYYKDHGVLSFTPNDIDLGIIINIKKEDSKYLYTIMVKDDIDFQVVKRYERNICKNERKAFEKYKEMLNAIVDLKVKGVKNKLASKHKRFDALVESYKLHYSKGLVN